MVDDGIGALRCALCELGSIISSCSSDVVDVVDLVVVEKEARGGWDDRRGLGRVDDGFVELVDGVVRADEYLDC